MSIEYIKTSYGYHSFSEVEGVHRGKVAMLNTANAMGYIPGLGLVIGVARAVFFWKMMNDHAEEMNEIDRKVCKLQVTRGVVEALGFGLVYLVADILVTVERQERQALDPEMVAEVEPSVSDYVVNDPPVIGYEQPLCPDLVEAWQRKNPDFQW